ncbi:mechanosensitive ion channel family protein [Pseudomaricurvus alkylphenolicus]|jgi:small conductance mechanosensitive channel|uniref:mechanosensitive ion channel family protein n=1 Tax=Pseudomaricurvus alkylphenolicus TaxID=1306991 RepID=UPI001421F5C6|nr:mechanosensitive ion channel family protein [Pseudomaricurvus alkylphenolicus]NIB43729.1 mechanosensitive ion channel family protein [Pseudomaricurvus alkylphenolicus]
MEENIGKELEQAAAIYQMVVEFFVNYSFQILGALLILIIGIIVARKVGNMVLALCERKNLDITLSRFIAATARIIVVIMVAIIALGKVGISVTPFLAAVGAISLGAGLAVQGLLSNYSAGLNIILTRPFVVGDTIQVQGVSGQVEEVHLAYTVLSNEDDVRITIPNKHIIGEIIHNSFKNTLAEISIGIAYHEDPMRAIELIKNAVCATDLFDKQKQPAIGIETFADSSINIGMRLWLPTQRYYENLYQLNQLVFKTLTENGIDIPFPQREVRLLNQPTENQP